MPSGSDGVRDMWWPDPWDAEAQAEQCFQRFGVRPRPHWVATYYGGRKALATASNIVFSNGLLDPWSGTGVLGDVNPRWVEWQSMHALGGSAWVHVVTDRKLIPPPQKNSGWWRSCSRKGRTTST